MWVLGKTINCLNIFKIRNQFTPVLFGMLGKKATAIYFVSIACVAVLFGPAPDQVYLSLGLSSQAMMGKASEVMPEWMKITGAFILLIFSIKPLYSGLIKLFIKNDNHAHERDCKSCGKRP